MKNRDIRALFFPHLGLESVKKLNTVLLYVDKIALIDFAHFESPVSRRHSSTRDLIRYSVTLQTLTKEGLAEFVNPKSLPPGLVEAAARGVSYDVLDPKFVKLCERLPPKNSWVIPKGPWCSERLLPPLEFEGSIGRAIAHIMRATGFDAYVQATRLLEEWCSRREHFPGLWEREQLPLVLGEALMIRLAMAAAAELGLVPLCYGRLHFHLLRSRVSAIANNRAVKAALYEYGYLKDVKATVLALEAISQAVPSLEDVPLEVVLKFRDSRRDDLERFREELRKLVTDIEGTPWDSDLSRHVAAVVDKEIKPSLQKIRDQIRECKDRFWVNALEKAAKLGPVPLIASIFAGLPPHIALAVAGSIPTAELILDHWAKKRNIKRNGLVFLLDAGSLARR